MVLTIRYYWSNFNKKINLNKKINYMTKEQAIEIIVKALEMSSKSGVFSLTDSATIVQAINKINELVEIIPNEN